MIAHGLPVACAWLACGLPATVAAGWLAGLAAQGLSMRSGGASLLLLTAPSNLWWPEGADGSVLPGLHKVFLAVLLLPDWIKCLLIDAAFIVFVR